MRDAVTTLVASSGPLLAVHVEGSRHNRFEAIHFEFEHGVLTLACDGDTDEVLASVTGAIEATEATVASTTALRELTGSTLDYAWELVNHRGYSDGFQLRFRAFDGVTVTVQLEAGASMLDMSQVVLGWNS